MLPKRFDVSHIDHGSVVNSHFIGIHDARNGQHVDRIVLAETFELPTSNSKVSTIRTLDRAARVHGFAGTEDQILVIAGVPFNQPGTTNILRVAPCDESLIFASDPE